MKIFGKTISKLVVAGIIFFACIICGGIAIIYSQTPAGRASSTERAFAQSITQTWQALPTNTSLPSETPLPTKTSLPTNTPKPSKTPLPTNTPAPPTETPAPIILTGSGDSIVDVPKGSDAALVHIVGNSASRYFGVTSYDSNNQTIDLLVNTTDPYDGVRPLDFRNDEWTVRFEVKAVGPWTIEVLPLSSIEYLTVPGQISGSGDYVFAIRGDIPDTAIISGNASSRYFGVISYNGGIDLLVNTTDPYNGTVLLHPDTLVIEVKAQDSWTVQITTK